MSLYSGYHTHYRLRRGIRQVLVIGFNREIQLEHLCAGGSCPPKLDGWGIMHPP